MRIGISGVSSTGKSSLAKAVAKATNLPLISEDRLVDEAFAYGKQLGYKFTTEYMPDFTEEDVTVFEQGFIEARYRADARYESYVSDQTPIDTMNYMLAFCSRSFKRNVLKEHTKRLEKILSTYHGIWYLPFGVLPIVDDHCRTTNPFFLLHLDFALRGMIEFYETKVQIYDLYMTELDKRVEAVLQGLPKNIEELPLLGM